MSDPPKATTADPAGPAEATRLAQATIDALSAHICVLDETGTILATNAAWRRFAETNPPTRDTVQVGANYLSVCEAAHGLSAEGAVAFAAGIRAVMAGGQAMFAMEYPCDAPMVPRWFEGRVTRFPGGPMRVVVAHENITARKQAEARLKGSEAQYRRLFEAAKDGILILNAETGMIEDVNPFLTELLGFTREEVLQKKVWELGCFKHLIANREKFAELQQIGYVRYEDLPLETTDGRKIAVEFVSNVYEVNGAKVIQCNVRDITKRKAAEAAIGRAVQRLNEAQRIGQMGDWEWDVATQAITWSPQVFAIFGRDPSLGPPRNYAEYLALLDAGSRVLQTERITQALESGDAPDYDLRMHRPNGEPAVLLGRAIPRKDQNGKVLGLYGTVQDITERKRAEEERTRLTRQMELLLVSTDEGINGMDLQGRCTFINRAGAAMLGRKPEEMVGQHLHELIHHHRADGSPYPLADCPLFHAFQKGEGCRVDTEVFWRKDGTSFPAEYSSHPIREAGVITGAVVTFNDITKRKQAEEALKLRAAELERFHRLSVGRELQMVDLKKEVNALAALAGRAPPYDLSFLEGKMGPRTQP